MTKYYYRLLYLISLCILFHTIVHAQVATNITPLYNSKKRAGVIYVQIAGYNTDDFCYEWIGPDGYKSSQLPPIKNLDFGYYFVKITDCKQVIANDIGNSCVEGKDYVHYNSVAIQGQTCDEFGTELSYFPKRVCSADPVLSIFAPPIVPACLEDAQYQW